MQLFGRNYSVPERETQYFGFIAQKRDFDKALLLVANILYFSIPALHFAIIRSQLFGSRERDAIFWVQSRRKRKSHSILSAISGALA